MMNRKSALKVGYEAVSELTTAGNATVRHTSGTALVQLQDGMVIRSRFRHSKTLSCQASRGLFD
jgi:hypothetical protein